MKIKCGKCKVLFKLPEKSKYKRKYCDKCSKQRKKDYEKAYLITADECEDCEY